MHLTEVLPRKSVRASLSIANGFCYLRENPYASFSKKTPCPHWLLEPKGFKKKDFPSIAKRYGYFQIQSFLRWVANRDNFARNINDLPEEGTNGKLFEVTIKYKNFEWAFSCTESEVTLHRNMPSISIITSR